MNQDQVVEKLLHLRSGVEDFSVTFTGKQSKKVDGLYKPDSREILLHNKNFNNDNALMYTAIHEFAHHIQFTTSPVPIKGRAHTVKFWDLFHTLLGEAERKGIYDNVFKEDSRFQELSDRIQSTCLKVDARVMKDLGGMLLEAHRLCKETGTSFEDYIDRGLQMNRTTAKSVMKIHALDIDPEVGYESMKTLSTIKDENEREVAKEALEQGDSPEMIRARFGRRPDPESKLEALIKEKERIEKGLERLTGELIVVEKRIEEVS